MTPLEKEFEAAMLDTYDQTSQFHYYPTYFLRMVQEYGGVGAAKRLLAAPNAQQGLYKLWELGGLDFSMEALVIQEKYQSLFTAEELAEAHKRLDALKYFDRKTKPGSKQ
jgi:hypothetical protein